MVVRSTPPCQPNKTSLYVRPPVRTWKNFLLTYIRTFVMTNGQLWYSKTVSKIFLERFVIIILVRHHVTFKVMVYKESTGCAVIS